MKPIIKVENLSKQYRLGTIGAGTVREDFQRWLHRIQGKEDPFLKVGETNDRSRKGTSDYVWALKDINFEVMPGEVLGIIGKNGAGKSTLLKILSKVTGPTTGRIDYNGRIGSLLEVGTGFHPELTGRENIFLNGAILGMTKREIRTKLDEIIDFSGCERYIDTPVKRYSSGMTVRLGFAVAAHLDPEILVVDEVLAVGDAEFQAKAIGKMQDVSRNEGRTVLFVSHNLTAIQTLCTKALLIKNGTVAFDGQVNQAIDKYLDNTQFVQEGKLDSKADIYNKTISIDEILINSGENHLVVFERGNNSVTITIKGTLTIPLNISFEAMLYDDHEQLIASYSPTHFSGKSHQFVEGEFVIEESILFPDTLSNGDYFLSIRLSQMNIEHLADISKLLKIRVSNNVNHSSGVSFDKSYFGYFLLGEAK